MVVVYRKALLLFQVVMRKLINFHGKLTYPVGDPRSCLNTGIYQTPVSRPRIMSIGLPPSIEVEGSRFDQHLIDSLISLRPL